MDWHDAEAAIRAHIEAAWPLSGYAHIGLAWENEPVGYATDYMAVIIDATFAEKSIYGSAGKRISVEGGIVFFHCFVSPMVGKRAATGPVVAMTQILELQTIGTSIKLEGGNPPSPVADGPEVPSEQPAGTYYRCSGSVPFIVLGNR